MAAMAATIAGLPAHEPSRRRFLADPRAVRLRAPSWRQAPPAATRTGAMATTKPSDARPARRACRAGRHRRLMLARCRRRANGGNCRSMLMSNAAGHARDGYLATRSQKQPRKPSAELGRSGLRRDVLVDGKAGSRHHAQAAALAATLEQLAHAGLDDFYAAISAARSCRP